MSKALGVRFDVPFERANQGRHHIEAEAGAAACADGFLTRGTIKAFEDTSQVVGGDADALVNDLNVEDPVMNLRTDSNVSGRVRVFDGVVEQIANDHL